MTSPSTTKPTRSDQRTAQARRIELAHERLGHLYEISKLMTKFGTAEQTVSEVLAVVTKVIPLRTANLLLEGQRGSMRTRAFAWHARDVDAVQLRSVKARARSAYVSLRRAAEGFDLDEQGIALLPDPVTSSGEPMARSTKEPLILLPLVVARGRVFGLVAMQSAVLLDETELAFINIVVTQLAIAIDRVVISDARHAETEAARNDAQRREREATALMTKARDAAELALERLEFTRAVADGLDEGVLAVDRDGRITLCNRAAAQLLGRREDEMLGSVVHDIVQAHRVNGTAISADDGPFSSVMRNASSVQSDEELFSRRGKRSFPVSYTAAPLRRRGEVYGAVLAFQDISERKEAEDARREAAGLFRMLAETVPDKIFIAKANGEGDYFNEQWAVFTGLPLDVVKASWTHLMHPEDMPESTRRWRHAIATGEPVQFEHRFQRADGVYRWHLGRAEPLRNAEGNVSMWIGSNTDIDDQKRVEAEQRFLAEVSNRLLSSTTYRDSMSGIAQSMVPLLADACMIDEVELSGEVRRREVVFADPAKQRDLGQLACSFAPSPDWQTPQATALASGLSFLWANVADADIVGIAHDDEHAQFMRDIGLKSMMVVPLLARGKTLGAITFMMAESERRYSSEDLGRAQRVAELVALAVDNSRLYESAQRAIAARDDLLAVVAHDLRNPLGAIIMGAAHGLMRPASDDRRSGRKSLEMMKRAGERMNRLIGDLVDVARFESGHIALDVEPIAIGPLLDEVIELHRSAAEQKALRLERVPPDEPLEVSGDRDRLLQVFGNLLGNAIKFSRAGSIIVRAERHDDEVLCSVADTGPGMPPDDVPHVFDRYWQAKKTARLGSGLGLSIVKSLVQAHGGRVWAESILGAGSTFSFSLPLSRLDGSETPGVDAPARERAKPR